MKARVANNDPLLRRLVQNDESATLAMFIQLCRESPDLRHWLWEDFGRDAKVRRKFARLIADPSSPPVDGFRELTDEAGPWQKERLLLRKQMPVELYGGLTWTEVTQLIRRYQAGTIDLGVFLLAQGWLKAGKSSPLLRGAGIEFLQQVIVHGNRRLLRHLHKAIELLKSYKNKAARRSLLGYYDYWKLRALLYILGHPREFYTTRELRAHLSTLGLNVGTKDMRRFCKRHGIKRDMRAGRPRAQITAKTAIAKNSQPPSKQSVSKAG